tara:strand:+ start:2313 stop:3914 length:1602 start_codon:yes stop_codon:yes gene_type:complete
MPLQIYQSPNAFADQVPVLTNWTPIVGYMIYQSDTTVDGFYYYQLAVAIYTGQDNTGDLIATLKQRRNGYSADVSAGRARAIFDIKDVANSILVDTIVDQNCTGVPFGSIHEVGTNTYECATDATDPLYPCTPMYSKSGDRNTGKTQIASLAVYGYEFYSTNVNDSPTNQPESAPSGSSPNSWRYYMKGTLPLTDPRHTTDAGTDPYVFQGNNANQFQPRTTLSRFLSDVNRDIEWQMPEGAMITNQYLNFLTDNDFHTVAFLNDYTNLASKIHLMRITYFDNTGSMLGTGDILNSNVAATPYGGCPADDGEAGGTPANVLDNSKRLLYFGCGVANLRGAASIDDELDPDDTVNRGWVYYKVQGIQDSGTAATAPYYFVKQAPDCKGYESVRLGFRNSLGCYDYFNFNMKSTQKVDIKRTTYDTMLGIYNKSVWRYNNTDRGVNVNNVTAKKTITLNTDWLQEGQVDLIEKLLISTNVFLIKKDNARENDISQSTIPVLIKDSSFTQKTKVNDKIKIQYTIQIELANNQNTNV